MPQDRHLSDRLRVLDYCFSDFNVKYTIPMLLAKVNEKLRTDGHKTIEVRTLRNDIKYMKEGQYKAPIEIYPHHGHSFFYRYSDRNFSIYSNPLSDEELDAIKQIIKLYGTTKSGSGSGWLENVMSDISERLQIGTQRENIVSFEQNQGLKGLENLTKLIKLTQEKFKLELTYCPFGGEPVTREFHPYHLKQYNNRWFLFGLEVNGDRSYICNKPLDRITRIIYLNRADYIPNTTINFETYFDDIVGVTINPDAVKVDVKMKFDEKRFPYVVNKKIHHSQVILSEEERIVQISVRPNKELKTLILSYGPQIEVLEPIELRAEIAQAIKQNLENYQTV